MDDAHDRSPLSRAPVTLPELQRILDHLPGMVAFWDREGRNRYANATYLEWFGRGPDELLGISLQSLLGADLYELNRPYIEGALAGEPQRFERTMEDAKGRKRYAETSYVPNFVHGEPDGFFVQVTDITSRVRAEQTLQDTVRQVALLQERERIAADLHDLVIQRLFAAGLDLAAAQRPGADRDARVEAAAVSVDRAIRELRGAIHSLHELMTPTQLPATIERLLANASRMLGFTPSMTYTGSLDVLPGEVIQDLLAVLNEALSNVARHAGAMSVDVALACSDSHVVLRVSDDGRGMKQAERRSGLANMRQRAAQLGGSFHSRDNDPTGTVIEWEVPVFRH